MCSTLPGLLPGKGRDHRSRSPSIMRLCTAGRTATISGPVPISTTVVLSRIVNRQLQKALCLPE